MKSTVLLVAGLAATAALQTMKGASLEPAAAASALGDALMSLAIYDPNLGLDLEGETGGGRPAAVAGWHGPVTKVGEVSTIDRESGVACGIYRQRGQGGNEQVVVAFRGCDGTTPNWLEALHAMLNEPGEQHVEAARLATEIRAELGPAVHLRFCGHSLGGSLATFAAITARTPAVTFGSLPSRTAAAAYFTPAQLQAAEARVLNFQMEGDPISLLALTMGTPLGRTVSLQPAEERPLHFLPLALQTAGFIFDDEDLRDTGKTSSFVYAKLERHRMANYVAGLLPLVQVHMGSVEILGDWQWKDSFLFHLVEGNTKLRLTGNRRVLLQAQLSSFLLSERNEYLDEGQWSFSDGLLSVTLDGIGVFTWVAEGGAPSDALLWRQTSFVPAQGSLSTQGALAETVKSVSRAAVLISWNNKTFIWIRPVP